MARFLLIATVDEYDRVYTLINLETGERVPLDVIEKDWIPFRNDDLEGTLASLVLARDRLTDLLESTGLDIVRHYLELVEEEIREVEDRIAMQEGVY